MFAILLLLLLSFIGCLRSQQSVYQALASVDYCTSCHTEKDFAEQTFYFSQSLVSPNNRSVGTVCWRQRQGQMLFKKDCQLWDGSVYSASNGLCLHWP